MMRARRWLLLLALLLWPGWGWAVCTDAQLTSEFQTDPQALGYAPFIANGQDQHVADILNQPRAGAAYQVNRGNVSTQLILQEIVLADLMPLLTGTPAKMPILQLYLGMTQLDTSDTDVQNVFLDLFPAGSPSRTNLVAFFKRQGSRADILCGGAVGLDQVSRALTPLRPS